MKLRFFLKDNKKIYTLEENDKTKSAHYKFIKIRDAPKSDLKFFKK